MRSFHTSATWSCISFSDDSILENPQVEIGGEMLLFICPSPPSNLPNCLDASVHIPGRKRDLTFWVRVW